MYRRTLLWAILCASFLALAPLTWAETNDSHLLNLQFRQRVPMDSGQYHTIIKDVSWNPKNTAIVVCDMWDQHWCQGATRRVSEMAARMNSTIQAARDKGVLIIHCPSSCLDYYKETPMRRLAQSATPLDTKRPLERWCHLDSAREGNLPIDDSDNGCDCAPKCPPGSPWTRQIAAIEISPEDAITDNEEAYYLMKQRGIDNVMVMGVHTNMCVLGRPFSIRQLTYQDQNVVLVRDLTDTMYNPRMPP